MQFYYYDLDYLPKTQPSDIVMFTSTYKIRGGTFNLYYKEIK
jgi:hypothetical protein